MRLIWAIPLIIGSLVIGGTAGIAYGTVSSISTVSAGQCAVLFGMVPADKRQAVLDKFNAGISGPKMALSDLSKTCGTLN